MRVHRFGVLLSSAATVALASLWLAGATPCLAAAEDQQSSLTDAQARIQKGDLRGAEIELRNAARANPSDPNPHIDLANLYLSVDNLPAAEAEARLAQQANGPADKVDPLLADALSRQGKFDDLFRLIQPGNRAPAAEARVRETLGTAHLAMGEADQAEPLLRDAERLDPASASAKVAMARLLLRKGDIAGARRELDDASATAKNDVQVERASAEVLRATGDTVGAVAQISRVLVDYPNDLAALALRADMLMSQGKLDDAAKDIDKAAKIAPSNVGVIFLQGVLSARRGDYQGADALLSQISTSFNNIPYAYFLQGVIKFQLHQYEEASSSLEKYSSRYPKLPEPRRLIARIDLIKRDYAGAIATLKPVVDADPTDTSSAIVLGQAYLMAGQRGDALALFEAAAKANPKDALAATNVATLEVEQGKTEQGLAALNQLAESAGGAAQAGPALVIAELHAGHIANAAKEAEALVQAKPNDSVAQVMLGTVRIVQKNYPEAIKILKAVVDRDPTLLDAQRELAQAYVSAGQIDDAKTVLKTLVTQHPNSVGDSIALGQVLAMLKDEDGATAVLRQAQQNSLNDPTPGIALLKIYASLKDWDKAQAYDHELEGLFPANADVIEAAASMLFDAGQAQDAARTYAQLVQAKPNSAAALVRYAQFQNAAGDTAGARASLVHANQIEPHNDQYMQLLVAFDLRASGTDAAIAAARSFADSDPIAAKLMEADILVGAKRPNDAIALLQAEQAKHPSGPIVATLADLLYASGKREDATRMLNDWVKAHNDAEPRLTLANIDLLTKNDAGAQALYEQVHAADPNNIVALNNLAGLYGKANDPRATEYAAQAYYLSPQPQIADTLGWLLVGTGQAKDGLPYLKVASAAVPQNASFQYHLAVALNATGQKDEAKTVLERLVNSKEGFGEKADAQHLLETLQHG